MRNRTGAGGGASIRKRIFLNF
eukprot:COSAG06_NODE_65705_length_256_cov_0.662420_1_plen_21_part_01